MSTKYVYTTIKNRLNVLRDKAVGLKDAVMRNMHPLTFLAYFEHEFSNTDTDWRDLEPDVVAYLFKDYPGMRDVVIGIHGAWATIADFGDDIDLDVLENSVMVFNGKSPSITWRQDMSVSDMCFYLNCINTGLPMEYDNINFKNYMSIFFKYKDFPVIIPNINDMINTSLGIWFKSSDIEEGPYSSEFYKNILNDVYAKLRDTDKVLLNFLKEIG